MGGVDICKVKWSFYEVFWRSSSPSTVPVHRATPEKMGNIPGNAQGSFSIIVELEPYMLKAYLGKIRNSEFQKFIKWTPKVSEI